MCFVCVASVDTPSVCVTSDEHTFVKGYIHKTYGNTSRRWTFIVYVVCVTLVDTLSVEVIKVN